MIQLLIMKQKPNMNSLSNTVRKQYYYLQLDIRSFNKIKIDTNWLKDLHNLIWLYNLKFYIHELKCISSSWLKLKSDLNDMITNKKFYDYKNSLVFRYKLREFINFKYRFYEFLKMKQFLFKKINIIRLPVKTPKINILKSPHVFKKAQDHYEIRNHKLIMKLPMLYWGKSFIENLIIRTSRLSSMNQVSFKRKNIIFMNNISNN